MFWDVSREKTTNSLKDSCMQIKKGADQTSASAQSDQHLCFSLSGNYKLIDKLATCKISAFQLVSVTEQAGFSLTWSETPKTGFLTLRHILITKS